MSVTALATLLSYFILRRSKAKIIAKGVAFLSIICVVSLVAISPMVFQAYSWFKGETGTSLALLPGLASLLLAGITGYLYLSLTNVRERIESLEKHVAILERLDGNA